LASKGEVGRVVEKRRRAKVEWKNVPFIQHVLTKHSRCDHEPIHRNIMCEFSRVRVRDLKKVENIAQDEESHKQCSIKRIGKDNHLRVAPLWNGKSRWLELQKPPIDGTAIMKWKMGAA